MGLRKETSPHHYCFLVISELFLTNAQGSQHRLPTVLEYTQKILQEFCLQHSVGEIYSTLAVAFLLCTQFEHSHDHIVAGGTVMKKLNSLVQQGLSWTTQEVSFQCFFFFFLFKEGQTQNV